MKPKKKTKAILTREYKICLFGMAQAIEDAQAHEKEVEEIERSTAAPTIIAVQAGMSRPSKVFPPVWL